MVNNLKKQLVLDLQSLGTSAATTNARLIEWLQDAFSHIHYALGAEVTKLRESIAHLQVSKLVLCF